MTVFSALTEYFTGDIIPGRKASFSSYPGLMTSGDDFYMLSSGMVSLYMYKNLGLQCEVLN